MSQKKEIEPVTEILEAEISKEKLIPLPPVEVQGTKVVKKPIPVKYFRNNIKK
jgi:hypothetical protein